MTEQTAIEFDLEKLLASLEATEEEQRTAKKWLVALDKYMDRPAGLPTMAPEITRMAWR
ncbi:MAG: hypothetical protein HY682_03375 [Chloroflexi bacterium]|nr:hypothetical protein [Chloroflexota bacterium]